MAMATATYVVILLILAATMLVAAIGDLRHFRISNRLVLVVALLYPFHFIAADVAGIAIAPWWVALLLMAATLGAGLIVFRLGLMGGGDVKLLAALAPWAGPIYLPAMVFLIAIAGGVVACATYLKLKFSPTARVSVNAGQTPSTPLGQAPVPYGVAIAVGGLYVVGELIVNALTQ